nr:MAG TPA: hypothetical protein [Caudoviricetes sp.]DAW86840.1 MAG TPA: hypothetical protein [Caudoviricetes sp.]
MVLCVLWASSRAAYSYRLSCRCFEPTSATAASRTVGAMGSYPHHSYDKLQLSYAIIRRTP